MCEISWSRLPSAGKLLIQCFFSHIITVAYIVFLMGARSAVCNTEKKNHLSAGQQPTTQGQTTLELLTRMTMNVPVWPSYSFD